MKRNAVPDKEIEIIQKAVLGDQDAFSQLFNQYYVPINRYIYFHVGNQQDTDDLTEMVFLNIWQSLPKFKQGKGTFKAWLYRIAHNQVVDFHRKKKPVNSIEEFINIAADTEKPENQTIAKQEILQLRKALLQLDERSRAVVIHRFIAGLDHHETAKLLGLSEGNVRIIQLRALKNMKEYFGEAENERTKR
jgi:RNA polymerase sigma-70 factor (ECF subfamily)